MPRNNQQHFPPASAFDDSASVDGGSTNNIFPGRIIAVTSSPSNGNHNNNNEFVVFNNNVTPVMGTVTTSNHNHNNNINNDFYDADEEMYPPPVVGNPLQNQMQQQNHHRIHQQPQIIIIRHNNNDDFGNNNNNQRGFNLAAMDPDSKRLVEELAHSCSWLKIYFVVAFLIVAANAFFSGLWWILAAIAPGILAYIGVRYYHSTILKFGSIFFLCVVGLRIFSMIIIFTDDDVSFTGSSGDTQRNQETTFKIFNVVAGVVGCLVDCYFGYKYVNLIYVLDREMDEEMLNYLKDFPANTCGCL